jgi:hypothetical protein
MRYELREICHGNKRITIASAHALEHAKLAYDICIEKLPEYVLGYELYDGVENVVLQRSVISDE